MHGDWESMRRVAIVGNLGGGKSTLAAALGEATGIPVHPLDPRHGQAIWDAMGAEEFEFEHAQLLLGDQWIIDGFASWPALSARLDAADTIILVDHPPRVHYAWALRRQVRWLLAGSGPRGERVRPVGDTVALLRKIHDVHRRVVPILRRMIAARSQGRRVIELRSPAQLRRFVRLLPSTSQDGAPPPQRPEAASSGASPADPGPWFVPYSLWALLPPQALPRSPRSDSSARIRRGSTFLAM